MKAQFLCRLVPLVLLLAVAAAGCDLGSSDENGGGNDGDSGPSYPNGGELIVNGGGVAGSVNYGDFKQYYFTGEANESYSVMLHYGSNDADLYVCTATPCSNSNADLGSSARLYDTELVEFVACCDQTYYLAAHGFSGQISTYTAEVFSQQLTELTVDGGTVSGTVGAGETVGYTFYTSTGENYTVTLTPVSGDPDLEVFTDAQFANSVGSSTAATGVDEVSFTGAQSQYWAVVTGFTEASYTIGVSSGSASDITVVSSDLTNPTMVDIGAGGVFSIPANADGYFGFPTQIVHAYGLYIDATFENLGITPGYVSGVSLTAVANTAYSLTEGSAAVGFRSAATAQTYVAWIDNLSGIESTLVFVVQEAALSGDANGGSSDTPVVLTVNTETWVAGRRGSSALADDWLSFTATSTGPWTLSFSGFTDDLDWSLFAEGDLESSISGPYTVQAGGNENYSEPLTSGVTYFLRLSVSTDLAVNQASVGKITVAPQ